MPNTITEQPAINTRISYGGFFRDQTLIYYDSDKKGEIVKHNRFVGVEIECEDGRRSEKLKDTIPYAAGISHDGSLGETGIEIQTPPAKMALLEEMIKKTCYALQEAGYKGTKKSGLHVHVDARDIQNKHTKIINVIKTFYACEDILFSMLPPSRWHSRYCKRLSREYLYNAFKQKTKEKKIDEIWYNENSFQHLENRKHQKYDSTRYFGLNVHSIFYRGTLEFRYHSGTVRPEKILKWVEIILSMVHYAIKNYKEEEISKMFDMETSYEKFICFLDLFKIQSNIESYMRERISLFNKNYRIKFNKGKHDREYSEMRKALIKRLYNKAVKEAYIEADKEIDKKLSDLQYIRWTFGVRTREAVKDKDILKIKRMRSKEIARENFPHNFYQLLFSKNNPVQNGFITESEISLILDNFDASTSMQEARESDSTDIEI